MHYKKKWLFLNEPKTCFKCIDLNIYSSYHFNNRFSNNQRFIIEFIEINEKYIK